MTRVLGVVPKTRLFNLSLYLFYFALFVRQVKVNPSNLQVALGKHLVYFSNHLTKPQHHPLSYFCNKFFYIFTISVILITIIIVENLWKLSSSQRLHCTQPFAVLKKLPTTLLVFLATSTRTGVIRLNLLSFTLFRLNSALSIFIGSCNFGYLLSFYFLLHSYME